MSFQHAPARGRKPQPLYIFILCLKFQHAPARGRKHQYNYPDQPAIPDFNTHEGTETQPGNYAAPIFVNFNTPLRGDGNIVSVLAIICSAKDFNMHPQGDGNSVAVPSLKVMVLISTYTRKGTETAFPAHKEYCLVGFQLAPARGRKLKSHSFSVVDNLLSTYPREGTETF